MNTFKTIALATLFLAALAFAPIGAVYAQVKVTAATPSSTVQGTVSLDVVVGGSGFDSSATAQFFVAGTVNPGGITVRKTTFRNSKEIVATIDVSDTAAVASFDIQVTLSSGRKGKGTTLFAVKQKAQVADACIGAQARGFPALVFMRQRNANGTVYWDTMLADAGGICEKTLFSHTYNDYGQDVSLRYDATAGRGVTVRDAPAFTAQVASIFQIDFDVSGAPAIQASAYSTVLTPADVPVPQDLASAGWSLSSTGSPFIAPDGSAVLLTMSLSKASGEQMYVLWVCPFDEMGPSVDKANCRVVYRGNGIIPHSWGGRSDSIFVLDTAPGGSGTALYRVQVADGSSSLLWSRGTLLTDVRAHVDGAASERVAIYEPNTTTRCAQVLVLDAGTCVDNSCQILNGAGHPLRSLTWLPDGRVAGSGQTPPNRRGQCSASGTIEAFDPNDTTGSTTRLVTDGSHPDGADGG